MCMQIDQVLPIIKLFSNRLWFISDFERQIFVHRYMLCDIYPSNKNNNNWTRREQNPKGKEAHFSFLRRICYGLSACMCPSCKSAHGSLDSYWKRLNENLTDTHTLTFARWTIINTFRSSFTHSPHLSALFSHIHFDCRLDKFLCELVVSTQLEPFVRDMHEFDEIKVISNLSIILNVILPFICFDRTCHNSSTINNIHIERSILGRAHSVS